MAEYVPTSVCPNSHLPTRNRPKTHFSPLRAPKMRMSALKAAKAARNKNPNMVVCFSSNCTHFLFLIIALALSQRRQHAVDRAEHVFLGVNFESRKKKLQKRRTWPMVQGYCPTPKLQNCVTYPPRHMNSFSSQNLLKFFLPNFRQFLPISIILDHCSAPSVFRCDSVMKTCHIRLYSTLNSAVLSIVSHLPSTYIQLHEVKSRRLPLFANLG